MLEHSLMNIDQKQDTSSIRSHYLN